VEGFLKVFAGVTSGLNRSLGFTNERPEKIALDRSILL
jgi:hypothetical protein